MGPRRQPVKEHQGKQTLGRARKQHVRGDPGPNAEAEALAKLGGRETTGSAGNDDADWRAGGSSVQASGGRHRRSITRPHRYPASAFEQKGRSAAAQDPRKVHALQQQREQSAAAAEDARSPVRGARRRAAT